MTEDADRRSRLRSLKLLALVRDHLDRTVDGQPAAFPPGAAVIDDRTGWVLLEDEPARGLGAALAWALRNGAAELNVLAHHGTGVLARRAAHVSMPVAVWHVEDRLLLPAMAEPPMAPVAPSPAHLALIPAIEAGGAVPNIEHGVVTGEVRGLEVCRVVDDAHSGAVRLEVGVGAHDREAFAILHGDIPAVEALAGVVDAVAAHRRPDGAEHPLNRLAPERLLRWRLEQDPGGDRHQGVDSGSATGAETEHQADGAVLGGRPASRRLTGARRVLGRRRPRRGAVRDRRPAAAGRR